MLLSEKSLIEIKKLKHSKLGVVIIARNEEQNIGNSLKSLVNQTLKPESIIVVDDGSTDKTFEIADSFKEVSVIKFQEKHESWLHEPELAKVFNLGISKLQNDLDFVMFSASDIIYPEEYLQSLVSSMNIETNVAIGGGVIQGERCHRPRGAGRIVRVDFLKSIGFGYPIRIGYEGYLLLKAEQLGYKVAVFPIAYKTARKSGVNYATKHFYNEGMSSKALGYSRLYVAGKAILLVFRNVKFAKRYVKGYFSEPKMYEKELRTFVAKRQNEIIFHRPRLLLYRLLNR